MITGSVFRMRTFYLIIPPVSSSLIKLIKCYFLFCFFFNDTATTEIYTLSLHDALPICFQEVRLDRAFRRSDRPAELQESRSEEHTSELQSLAYLVCRLLLEKKKKI